MREYRKGDSLRGYVAVRLPSGMIIREITVHQRGSSRWASPPAKPITQDGQPCLDPRGKQIWMEYISFVDKHTRDRFSISVCNAVARRVAV
jgi:hypothetical protein